MDIEKYCVKLTFTRELLGTVPKDPKIYESYVASKAPDPENGLAEVATVEEVEEKGWTGFHQLDGRPAIYDYAIKGFCKDACGMLRRVDGTKSKKVTAYKKEIDGRIFVTPRLIPVTFEGELGKLERPLRADTAQGPRVSLARSDTAPEGATMEFTLQVLGLKEALLREWFDYGQLRGLGQWRNAGYGSFTYEMEKEG